MRRTLLAVGVALALALGAPLGMATSPAWSQSPGLTDPVVAPEDDAPTSLDPLPQVTGWTLSDLLWGLAQLEQSPRRLTEQQKETIRPQVDRVLAGAELVNEFDARVEAILNTEQIAYIQHLAATGALAGDPLDLPIVPAGEDPLVVRVVEILEERAR